MVSHRTTLRALLILLSLGFLFGTADTASAATGKKGKAPPDQIVFPVIGDVWYMNDFGAPRSQGSHQANDIMADWKAPVVAAESGKVRLWSQSSRAGCMIYLYGESGTTYLYIHLNNDLTKRRDNRGGCGDGISWAPGLKDGQQVAAGQMIGYNGDSGNAEGIYHLHFEMHPNDGAAVSPFNWLNNAQRLLFPAPPDLGAAGFHGKLPLRLRLQGRVVESAEGWLKIAVRRVMMSNRWYYKHERELVVTVLDETPVYRTANRQRNVAKLARAVPGEKVVAWTTELQPILFHQVAEPGVIWASQVILRGKARR